MKAIKALFVAVFFTFCATMAMADSNGAYFKVGEFEATYPLANTSVVSLYDFAQGQGLLGAETKLAVWQMFNLNFGYVTSFLANGMPYVSVDFNFGKIATKYDSFLSGVGIFAGHDFKNNDNRIGLKSSVPLW